MTHTVAAASKARNLEALLRHPQLWLSSEGQGAGLATLSTGNSALDALLPGGGWPLGGLTEIVVERQGLGEVAFVLPALAELGAKGRAITWVAPPYVPYAPALEQRGLDLPRLLWIKAPGLDERLWAAEQALRSGTCGAVLLWLGPEHAARVNVKSLRRLQLAAEQGEALGMLFWRRAMDASPAVLRLRVGVVAAAGRGNRVAVEILKCRGPGVNRQVQVQLR